MEIKTFSTGSKEGNCFWVNDGHTQLLLDCGISIKKIQKALDFRLREIQGCLVSHRHLDHCKGLRGLLDKEVDVYMPEVERAAMEVSHYRLKGLQPLEQFEIGTWTILPFPVEHDTEGPLGYLLQSATGDKLLFATDTYYIRYAFKGMTHMLIECNYSQEILQENLDSGAIPYFRAKRTVETHFSLENLLVFLKACDLSKLQEIRLIHLSDANSHAEQFKRAIQIATGVPTFIEG